MPVFKQKSKEEKQRKKLGIPQEVIDEYKKYIEQLERKNIGILEFKKNENINLARKALLQAGEELRKYVKVRKPRNEENVLHFERITQKEWREARKKTRTRGAKLRGRSRGKAKAGKRKG